MVTICTPVRKPTERRLLAAALVCAFSLIFNGLNAQESQQPLPLATFFLKNYWPVERFFEGRFFLKNKIPNLPNGSFGAASYQKSDGWKLQKTPVIQPNLLPNWREDCLPLFCKIEHRAGKKLPLPVKFRLGSVEYVDWLEGKREF